ncbi:MAG: undecaprenyldiphospho-muramoylpentapeptide beta-N-acetylglucosaminyltransferase [Prolixibacteraceae bacterium]|jgi:UDP-N-acetylglucosamine--N-acetylmuramyl-(pentapeptide) pyrophosphoryl-undecaprenol N-acetylglucosamine transferase|nr:undecaprenyldiphospho-muramoylpentapeptide beta-N-acetylglucosaminyltransferase [Prolixibacteraceae bacterium]
MTRKLKIIISGGGTGGHIFPALSIAGAVKQQHPDSEILFVGALGRMEMERVPAAGYRIIGLPVVGFPRKPGVKMLLFIMKLRQSMKQARAIVREFGPDVVVGVGGYASGPVLRAAAKMKIPTLIQEQNSYAGITNRLLAKKADKICVAYDDMERYFPASKIVFTGNPVRSELLNGLLKTDEARTFYNLQPSKKVLLVVGGSLGARTINQSMLAGLEKLKNSDVEVIWQTGKYYYESILEELEGRELPNVHVYQFLSRMDLAYAVADLVVSRAGAGTISELCLMRKPSFLVPSPNVAEDHQTKNALALAQQNAAIMVADDEAPEKLVSEALGVINNDKMLNELAINIEKLAKPDAAEDIAGLVVELAKRK